jgi:rubrerythrin
MRVSELVSDLQALRSNLAEELQAVNRYEPLIDSLAHDEARAVVKRIVDARKEHVAMLSTVIEQLDPRQRDANIAHGASRPGS